MTYTDDELRMFHDTGYRPGYAKDLRVGDTVALRQGSFSEEQRTGDPAPIETFEVDRVDLTTTPTLGFGDEPWKLVKLVWRDADGIPSHRQMDFHYPLFIRSSQRELSDPA